MHDQPTVFRVVAGAVLLWAAAVLVTVVVPIGEPQEAEATIQALTWRD